ncbi:MAG: response regulator [Bacteroidales bacterium]|nr:response regulator [Bacteroidales bacterium]MBO7141653.1 response regulator [Bacteroidales bacterium]
MNAKKILIVEDDKMLCTIFQMFIQELNYEIVATVRTGEDAVAACDTYSDIDVIMMDIHLDGNIDGVETAKIIAQKHKTPIIFITGDSSPSTIEAATLQNVYGFMTKPVYKRNLGVAIEYAFAKYRKG